MKITRRTDYAIRLIAALHGRGQVPYSVQAAADAQEVPYAFARSIQHALMHQGIIRTVRGSLGGMILNVDLGELTLYQLIEIVQGPVSVSICANDAAWCTRRKSCQFHRVWKGVDTIIEEYLSAINIKELLDGAYPHLFCPPPAEGAAPQAAAQ